MGGKRLNQDLRSGFTPRLLGKKPHASGFSLKIIMILHALGEDLFIVGHAIVKESKSAGGLDAFAEHSREGIRVHCLNTYGSSIVEFDAGAALENE